MVQSQDVYQNFRSLLLLRKNTLTGIEIHVPHGNRPHYFRKQQIKCLWEHVQILHAWKLQIGSNVPYTLEARVGRQYTPVSQL